MTNFDLDHFLLNGAFVRPSQDRVVLYSGPFQFESSSEKIREQGSPSNRVHCLYVQEFFSNSGIFWQKDLYHSETHIQTFTRDEFIRILENGLDSNHSDFHDKDLIRREEFILSSIDSFKESFHIIQNKIKSSEIEKAVPMNISKTHKRPRKREIAKWLLNLIQQPDSLFPFGFWNQEMGGVLGATPEFLFWKKKKLIKSLALAGTAPLNHTAYRLPLDRDPKEVWEHELVVRDIECQLKKWGEVRRSEIRMLRLPSLFHLATDLELISDSDQVVPGLIEALHPTPALGVSPREYGHQWLKNLPDQENRRYFGAPVSFYLSSDEILTLVAIRQIEWDARSTYISVGCGIVSESNWEREWKELMDKRESIFKTLGL